MRADDAQGGRDALNRATEFAMALTLPATVALIAIPGAVTEALFERGAFDAADTRATALALTIYALGLPAFVQQKIVQPAYFAREDTATPLRYAAISMLVNLGVAVGLAPAIGWPAAALGTVLAAWVNLALLWRGAAGIGADLTPDPRLIARVWRMGLSAGLMGAVLLGLGHAVSGLDPVPALALLVLAGGGCYSVSVFGLGAVRRDDLVSALAKERG